jgi:hypothetical protein
MEVAVVGSALSSLGSSPYGFTKLNDKQLYQAAESLQGEGEISIDQEPSESFAMNA